MRRRFMHIAVVILAGLALAPVVEGGGNELRVELEGRPIPPTEAGNYHCHDFDYPLIRCYRTSAELEDAAARRTEGGGLDGMDTGSADAGTASVSYVRVFSDANHKGTSAYLNQPYDRLGDIGWNDRISSFTSLTSAGGRFWQDTYGRGWSYSFCCLQSVGYVGDAYNDQFSSAYPSQ